MPGRKLRVLDVVPFEEGTYAIESSGREAIRRPVSPGDGWCGRAPGEERLDLLNARESSECRIRYAPAHGLAQVGALVDCGRADERGRVCKVG